METIHFPICCLGNCVDTGLFIKAGNTIKGLSSGGDHPVCEVPCGGMKETGESGQRCFIGNAKTKEVKCEIL